MPGDVVFALFQLAFVLVPAFFVIKLIIAIINWLNRH